MEKIEVIMDFMNDTFSNVPAAKIEEYRPYDKNSEYEFNVYKTAKHGAPEETAYLRAISAAINESKLKIYADYYMNHGNCILATMKINDRRIEFYIETENYKD